MLCCYSDLTQILDTHLQQLLLMLEIGTAGDIIVCDLLFRAVLLLMSLPYGESPPAVLVAVGFHGRHTHLDRSCCQATC